MPADPSFQWFDTFDVNTYSEASPPPPGTEWVPVEPSAGGFTAYNNGVLEITAPAGQTTLRGVKSVRTYRAGAFHARIKVEEVRCGADFYFTVQGPAHSGVGWYFSGLDGRANRMHFYTGS